MTNQQQIETSTQVEQNLPPPGYPTTSPPNNSQAAGKKKKKRRFFRVKNRGEKGFLEGCLAGLCCCFVCEECCC